MSYWQSATRLQVFNCNSNRLISDNKRHSQSSCVTGQWGMILFPDCARQIYVGTVCEILGEKLVQILAESGKAPSLSKSKIILNKRVMPHQQPFEGKVNSKQPCSGVFIYMSMGSFHHSKSRSLATGKASSLSKSKIFLKKVSCPITSRLNTRSTQGYKTDSH